MPQPKVKTTITAAKNIINLTGTTTTAKALKDAASGKVILRPHTYPTLTCDDNRVGDSQHLFEFRGLKIYKLLDS